MRAGLVNEATGQQIDRFGCEATTSLALKTTGGFHCGIRRVTFAAGCILLSLVSVAEGVIWREQNTELCGCCLNDFHQVSLNIYAIFKVTPV